MYPAWLDTRAASRDIGDGIADSQDYASQAHNRALRDSLGQLYIILYINVIVTAKTERSLEITRN